MLLAAAALPAAAADSYQLYLDFIRTHEHAALTFRQTTRSSGGDINDAAGSMHYSRPDRFYIRYTTPEPIEVVSDGRQISVYEKLLNQVQITDIDNNWLANGLVALLTAEDPKAKFTFSQPPAADSSYAWLLALPHDEEQAQFEELRLAFTDSGVLERMHVIDLFGNRIEAAISDVRIAEYGDEDYRFVPPPGAEIYIQQ